MKGKNTIILNPIGSLIFINESEASWQDILSSPQKCRDAIGIMQLAPCAKNIIALLQVIRLRFKTVIVTDYDSDAVRIIARHFGIPAIAVIGGKQSKVSQYNRALRKAEAFASDAVIVSGNTSDLHAAESAGLSGLRYGAERYARGVRCAEDICFHLGIRWESTPLKANKNKSTK